MENIAEWDFYSFYCHYQTWGKEGGEGISPYEQALKCPKTDFHGRKKPFVAMLRAPCKQKPDFVLQ